MPHIFLLGRADAQGKKSQIFSHLLETFLLWQNKKSPESKEAALPVLSLCFPPFLICLD
jgi:hypothetical protein